MWWFFLFIYQAFTAGWVYGGKCDSVLKNGGRSILLLDGLPGPGSCFAGLEHHVSRQIAPAICRCRQILRYL